jgi:NAD(P)H-dependent FMN reductase
MITVSVIVGSTRQGRFSEKPAQWILPARLIELRDLPMPFFEPLFRQLCRAGHLTNTTWLRSGPATSRRRTVLYS